MCCGRFAEETAQVRPLEAQPESRHWGHPTQMGTGALGEARSLPLVPREGGLQGVQPGCWYLGQLLWQAPVWGRRHP